MTIAKLSRLLESVRERSRARFIQENILLEWATKVTINTIAATAQDESGKFAKEINKIRLPWTQFGFPEVVGEQHEEQEEYDPNSKPAWVQQGDSSAADKNVGKSFPFGGF